MEAMASSPHHVQRGYNNMADRLPVDPNIRNLIADMLCISGGDRETADIISISCVLDSAILNHRPSRSMECDCYMLSVERSNPLRGSRLPHEEPRGGQMQ